MALSQHPTTMENLPDLVLSEIFIRLLAKQLAQMRCVCKPWNALLSRILIYKIPPHSFNSNQRRDSHVLQNFFPFDCNSPFTMRPSCSPHLDLTDSIKPPIKLQHKYGDGDIIGSVNGLICFSYQSSPRDYNIHIWNPSLSALLKLSQCPWTPYHTLFGFGFDPTADDYKVVKLTHISNMVLQCKVYSMRKGSWETKSQTFPPDITIIGYDNNQVCVADRLHWLGSTNANWKPATIVAFDLGGEAYFEMSLPDSILHKLEYHLDVLGVLSGKLCVMSCVRDGGECVVWLMGEYGVDGSWVKHHVFPPFSGNIIPYGFTSHDEFLFQVDDHDDRFGLYDTVAAKTIIFKITSIDTCSCKVVEYVDSLVWIQPTAIVCKSEEGSTRQRFYN